MTRRRPPPSGSGRFAFATAGSLSYVARGATWQCGRRSPSVRR
jgi:hypothetical protein